MPPPDIPRQQEFQAMLLYLWGQCTAWSPAGDAGRIKHHIEATAVWVASTLAPPCIGLGC